MATGSHSDVSAHLDSLVELFIAARALSSVTARLFLSHDGHIQGCEGDPLEVFGVDGVSLRSQPDLFLTSIHAADQPLWNQRVARLAEAPFQNFNLRLRSATGKVNIFATQLTERAAGLEVGLIDSRAAAYQMGVIAHTLIRSVMETTEDFIFVKDAHHVLITASQSMADLCDPIPDWKDFAGRTDYEVFPEHLADRYYDIETPVYEGADVSRELQPFNRPDGSPGWVDNRKYPIRDAEGKTIGLFGIARDVTEQVDTAQALALSASVFENSSEGIVILDLEGRVIQANEVFVKHIAQPLSAMAGKELASLQRITGHELTFADVKEQLTLDGYWQGEVRHTKGSFVHFERMRYTTVCDENGEPHHYVGLHTDITDEKNHERELERMAHYDELTGLPNRTLLSDRLGQAIANASRRDTHVAVAYIDIDGFKQINDVHGHETGDRFLCAIGTAMQRVLRDSDTLARIGGDEFVAVIADLEGPKAHLNVLARLLAAASAPVFLNELSLNCSASIGVASYPNDGTEADLLMRRADQAMYQAKQDGKNTVNLFGSEDSTNALTREEIIAAMEAGQLSLYYHPKLDIRSGEILGAEALARWQHEQRGLLMPADFLSAVVRENLEIMFGEWVLKKAIKQLARWRSIGININVSVNVSPRHLKRPDFFDTVQALLARYDLEGTRGLQLEILETTEINDLNVVADLIESFSEPGVGFALDDFGTGFSSMTYLRRLPVDVVKIDQSFVQNMLQNEEDHSIVSSIISLCQVLDKTVLAEGVATMAHARELVRMGCQRGQGYGIAEPMTAEAMEAWVKDWHARGRSQWLEAVTA